MRAIYVVAACLTLVACAGGENEDLRQWVHDASKGLKDKIKKMKEIKTYEPIPYDAGGLLVPFKL